MNHITVNESNFEKARNQIKKNLKEGRKTIFAGIDDELNRKILEKEKIDIFLPELKNRKDFQKQRNSGFNHVLAKIAKKNNVKIGIDLSEILEASEKTKADIFARIRQNVKICGKNKLKMKFLNVDGKNVHDLKALGTVLGMPTWMTKEL